ncbi:hypothetical protein [Halodesulfovibrio marinisediminis]|uniref:Cysteine-rich KTR n=1 Tax=Halodesulfovibrio marinisediminis DSM 17456 TaxID=1121457 RepID=A0A1N6DT94_9BACT|nr:hypothetical protein [Halodesulfovibrio marinisediminis]SIN73917.1 hypothetical protein SAMN02745161_0457 [Halodesulfovibrio marinisediminis DSM 17456]
MEKKVRCPYCGKVFRCRIRSISGEGRVIDLTCPYCKEQLILKTDMITEAS